MSTVLDFLLGATSFIFVLSIVVFVHEFGHFQVARWLGVKIDAFSIGFGKELAAWNDKQGVRWRIGMLPLGGYVKFTGDKDASSFPDDIHEDAEDLNITDKKGLFHFMPVWVRSAVTLAGPMFNFIFSILVFTILYASLGETIRKPVIGTVMEGGAAQKAGLLAGDEFIKIDNDFVENASDVQRLIVTSGGEKLNVIVRRAGVEVPISVTPNVTERETPFGDKEKQGFLGINFSVDRGVLSEKKYNIFNAFTKSVNKVYEVISMQVKFIGALLRGAMSPGHLSGPLGIGQSAELVAKSSLNSAGPDASFIDKVGSLGIGLIELSSILSIAIGFMNLLPLPILDGGHLVFQAIEALRGRPVSHNIQAASYKVGFACLMFLFVFATIQDLDRFGLFKMFGH